MIMILKSSQINPQVVCFAFAIQGYSNAENDLKQLYCMNQFYTEVYAHTPY